MKKIVVFLLSLLMGTLAFGERIALIGAMDSEIELLKKEIKNIKSEKIGEIEYFQGQLEGKDIVLLKTGVGKVNAAIGANTVIRE